MLVSSCDENNLARCVSQGKQCDCDSATLVASPDHIHCGECTTIWMTSALEGAALDAWRRVCLEKTEIIPTRLLEPTKGSIVEACAPEKPCCTGIVQFQGYCCGEAVGLITTPLVGTNDILSWGSNPTTIARNTSIALVVDGGMAPYTWSVSGTGFTIGKGTEYDGQNVLTADNTACGAVKITVLDLCGDQVTEYILCTTGGWTHICDGDNLSDTCAGWHAAIYEYPTPATRLTLTVGCHFSPTNCIYYECGGYTSYVPDSVTDCKVPQPSGPGGCSAQPGKCRHYSVHITVHEWLCP